MAMADALPHGARQSIGQSFPYRILTADTLPLPVNPDFGYRVNRLARELHRNMSIYGRTGCFFPYPTRHFSKTDGIRAGGHAVIPLQHAGSAFPASCAVS
jgi:hypothetical protein